MGSVGTEGVNDPLIGRVLASRYHIQELVAKGGMGRIYRAIQKPLGRTVAVKVLSAGQGEDDSFRQRFSREASICSKLKHPNTVRIFDYGNEGETYFIVMELLDGRTLTQLIRTDGPMPPSRVISLSRQICRSLGEAHSQGVIHRDLKPSNIFISRHGTEEHVKVLDFGLVTMEGASRVTQAGKILGSPLYMAPEQVMGQPVTPQTDVYALGMVLYAMITRTLPFKREHPMAVLNAQINAPLPTFKRIAPELEVPSNLEWVVRACLEKSMSDRFRSMAEVDRALKLCQRYDHTLELSLDTGRLVLPDGIEESNPDVSATLNRPTATPRPAPQEIVTNPTLAQRAASPALEFTVAAALVMLLLTVAAGAVGVGWYMGSKNRAVTETSPPVQELKAPPEQAVEVQPDPTEDPTPALTTEPEPDPVIPPKESTAPKKKRPKKTAPVKAKAPEGNTTKAPQQPPEAIEPDPAPDDAETKEDDGSWSQPTTDLRDPWAK